MDEQTNLNAIFGWNMKLESLEFAVELMRQIADAIVELARKIVELMKPLVEDFVEKINAGLEKWERELWYERLREWGVPEFLAMWLVCHLPRAWVWRSLRVRLL